MRLRHKIIWLTGASSGIGEALARELAQRGARLAITARSADKLEKLAAELRTGGGDVLAIPGDVTNPIRMKEIAVRIQRELGPIDLLLTNAGTYKPTAPEKFDAAEYDEIMKLNYSGMLYCIEAVLPEMLKRKSGRIAGVSSIVGYRGLPRSCSYGASKAAVISFLESLRFDLLPHNIGVTVINPGFVHTPLTAKNDFPMPFAISAERAALYIADGLECEKKEIHFPPALSWLFKLNRILPYPIYEFIIERQTRRNG